VQDTLERSLKNFERLVPSSNERAWVVTILHNLFIDHCRKRKWERQCHSTDDVVLAAPVEEPTEPEPWQAVTTEQLYAALAQIGDEFSQTYRLYAIDGRSYKEIAAELGVPIATVGTRLVRARRKLRAILGAHLSIAD
jgi:RNA polymerase sigma-70 factor (ECF subfamily)